MSLMKLFSLARYGIYFSFLIMQYFFWLCEIVTSWLITNVFLGQPLRATVPCLVENRFESSGGAGGTYIYVNPYKELKNDLTSVTDRAAQTIFWTELFRGLLRF